MPEHLRASVRRRHEQTLERATAALARLSAAGRPITFAAVARERHVSTDFLYRQPVLRLKIQQLRTTNRRMPEVLPAPTASPSAPVLAPLLPAERPEKAPPSGGHGAEECASRSTRRKPCSAWTTRIL